MDKIFRISFFSKHQKRQSGSSRISNFDNISRLKESHLAYLLRKNKIFSNIPHKRDGSNFHLINLKLSDYGSVFENNSKLYKSILKNSFYKKTPKICKNKNSLIDQASSFFGKYKDPEYQENQSFHNEKEKFIHSLRYNHHSNLSSKCKADIFAPSKRRNSTGTKIKKVSITNVSLPSHFNYKIPSFPFQKSPIQLRF